MGACWSRGLGFSKHATPRSEGDILQSSSLKNFRLNVLKKAIHNFRPDRVLGKSRLGVVFKGWIHERSLKPTPPGTGMVVAVKKLYQGISQDHQEWLVEINYLGRLRHPNLVKLIGYCLEDERRFLVYMYEFVSRGSVDYHLFRGYGHFQPLSFSLRMKIALGTAKGLAFLHSEEPQVICGFLKTCNILLNEHYDVKLSEFELARHMPSVKVYSVDGGYDAPEYISTDFLSAKSDVYSFGVVLLEMLTRRRALDVNRPHGEQMLAEWLKPHLSNKEMILYVLDPCMKGQYSAEHAIKLANIILKCLSIEPKARPNISEVVKELETLQWSE